MVCAILLSDDGMTGIRSTIISQIEKVASEQRKKLSPLADELALANSGLDSLCFAILVARLEDVFGFEPFTASEHVYYPVTFGDFVRCYEDAAK